MNLAFCTLDKLHHLAERYETLSATEKERRKGFLICTECNQPAYFTKKSKDGRGASFGSKSHMDDCTLASSNNVESKEGILEEEDQFVNDPRKIILDLSYGSKEIEHVVEKGAVVPGGKSATGKEHVGYGVGVSNSSRRLSTILRNLIALPKYRTIKQAISMPEIGERYACDLFKELKDGETILGEYYLFWGEIISYNANAYRVFIQGGYTDILVVKSVYEEIKDRYKLDSMSDLVGRYVIALGKCSGGYTRINDVNRIHLMKIA